jgi:hypothetical protein
VGFRRTGTHSVKSALEKLGLGPCYHLEDCFKRGDSARWVLVKSAVRRSDPSLSFSSLSYGGRSPPYSATAPAPPCPLPPRPGFQSTVDFPASVYFKELI